ncbi:hypothetical protein N9V27_00910 [bacterium]|nr:hypothetical protein [bacterium]
MRTPVTTLNEIDQSVIDKLLYEFENNVHTTEHAFGRKFAFGMTSALHLLGPMINEYLGEEWVVTGGNYFSTEAGYMVHTDTGRGESPDQVLQTFVFPLFIERNLELEYFPENNRFIVMDQQWKKDAGFFAKGNVNKDRMKSDNKGWKTDRKEWNTDVTDYSDVIGIKEDGYFDPILLKYAKHIPQSTFEGLSVDKHFQWTPGIPMTFPRDRLHCSTAFPRWGVKRKIGLSIFTSKKLTDADKHWDWATKDSPQMVQPPKQKILSTQLEEHNKTWKEKSA